MLGVILYLYFLFIGFLYGCYAFRDRDIYFKGWMGGIFGNVILMAGIVLPSLFFGFSYISHIILVVISGIPLLFLAKRHGIKNVVFNTDVTECGINIKILAFLILPVVLLISVIMTNHILAPYGTQGVASGQCTFGDLQMHLAFVTSIAEQKTFPPNYALLDGAKLNYPFFADMLSSSLYLFKTPLRYAVLIPSYVLSLLVVMGFYIIAYRMTGKKSAAVLATILFFLGGGFGFAYFFDGVKGDISTFTDIFTGYYTTPTNLVDKNIRWVNPICDMIIPQRTTMAGWTIFFPTFYLLLCATEKNKTKDYVILALLAGLMPMIHTHSFLALGIMSAVLFFANLSKNTDKKQYIKNWVIYGAIVFVLAVPQLFFWTFRQVSDSKSFLRFGFNWANKTDSYLWFYLKNWGITAIFAVPAILKASRENKKILLAAGVIFLLAEFVLFQPNEYDNNKLIFIVYMILVIAVSDYLIYLWKAAANVRGRTFFATVIVISGTLSGVLSIIREYMSGAEYLTYSNDDLEMAEYIREETPSDAVFLTSSYHLNPVVSLAGRNIYVGSSLYVYYHGMGEEYYKRDGEIKNAYGADYKTLKAFCEEKDIDYIYVGENERRECEINEETLSELDVVYRVGTETLYKIK